MYVTHVPSARPLQITKEKKVDFDPCCVSYFSSGEFLVAGGSDKKVRDRAGAGAATAIGEKRYSPPHPPL